MHCFGPLFVLIINVFLIYTYISILKNVFPFWYINFFSYESNKIFYIIYKSLITLELFYSLFNNLLAFIIKPGNINDLRKSKFYKTHSPYFSDKLLFPISSKEINKKNIIYNEKEILQKSKNIKNKNNNWELCKICKEIKPLRTHHCIICGTCVIKMDHHCPWINNCIGQNNHRYFLLFLLHVFIYTCICTTFILPVFLFHKKKYLQFEMHKKNKKSNLEEIKYLGFFGIICIFIEIFFSGWNWFLAINGNTALEFWAEKSGYQLYKGIFNYSFGSWKKNIFYIFGTNNLFKIIFIPSIKKLPFSGLEISKFYDPEFYIEGIN